MSHVLAPISAPFERDATRLRIIYEAGAIPQWEVAKFERDRNCRRHWRSIIARCYDNHSALLIHITSSGLGYSTQPPLRHDDHDHHDEMEAGLDFYAGSIA